MTTRSLRHLARTWSAPAALFAMLIAALGNAGCGQTACIQWSLAEGACPNRVDAQAFFGTCNDIASIDDDGVYSKNLCCYSVTKGNPDVFCGDESTGFGSGPTTGIAVGVTGPTTITATTGFPGGVCDQSGICGFDLADTGGCVGCALKGACSLEFDTCNHSTACSNFSACLGKCDPKTTPSCADLCAKDNAEGAKLFTAMVDCAVCGQCPNDCASMMSVCSSGSSGAGGGSGAGGAGGGGAGGASGAGGAGGAGGKP